MIISITAKMGSGKDLVGKIIQQLILYPYAKSSNLVFENETEIDFIERVCLDEKWNLPGSGFQIKKWADKLREVSAILLGLKKEFLYTDEFKKMALPTSWNLIYEEMTCGCDLVMEKWHENHKCINCGAPTIITSTPMTGREFLQKIGTNAMRNGLHPEVWVNALMSEYILMKGYGYTSDDRNRYAEIVPDKYPNWIVTDTRFPNEFKAVKEKNAITIKIKRDIHLRYPKQWEEFRKIFQYENLVTEVKFIEWLQKHTDEEYKNLGFAIVHPSETSLDNLENEFKYIIENNGTIEELILKVKEILIKENIIK